MRMWLVVTVVALSPGLLVADDLDWLLKQSTTRAATQPSTQPAAPFASKSNPEARPGSLTLSGGQVFKGQLCTTREKPIRIHDEKDKEYRDVPLALIKSMEAIVNWERDEKEWHFKETGSDIKEYSGKTYPAREIKYRVTLINGQSFTGGIVAPLYVSQDDKQRMFVINKRQKGDVGQTLKDLLYVKRVEFD